MATKIDTKTSVKKCVHPGSNFIAFIPSRSIRQTWRICLELDSKGLYQSSGKAKEGSFSRFHVLHKTWDYNFKAVSRRSRETTARECTKKRDASAKMLFSLLNLLFFKTFSLPSNFCEFCVFFQRSAKIKFPQIKITYTAYIFPAKIYSRVNIL